MGGHNSLGETIFTSEYCPGGIIHGGTLFTPTPGSQLALKKSVAECSSLFWKSMTNSEEYV